MKNLQDISTPSRTQYGDLAYSPFGIGLLGGISCGNSLAGSGPNDFAGHLARDARRSRAGARALRSPDTPDNLFDSPNRLLAPMMARWLSPDPADLAAVNPANPRSWNAYAYVANQPLEFTDPLGLGSGCGPIPGTEPPPNAVYSCPGGWVGVPFTFYTQGVAYPPVPPMWEMGCDGGCISGILAAQAAGLLSLADNFASGLGGYSNAPGSSGGAGISAGTTKITSRFRCAEEFADAHSIAAALDINAQQHPVEALVANAALGNSITGAIELAQGLWHGNATGTLAALVTGGLRQGLPGPGNGIASDGIVGTIGNGILNAATGAEEITTLSGTAVMDGLAAPIALVKFAYDAGSVFYGYFGACHQ